MPLTADRPNPLRTILLAGAILFVAGSAAVFAFRCAAYSAFERSCDRVRVGMTLAEVEAVLGPGERVTAVPQMGVRPVVGGDVFYRWAAVPRGYPEMMYVGFCGGVVCDTWYHNLNYL
jgi:hypothetical protein